MRDAIYNWLTKEFEQIAKRLDEEGRTDLDGKLWSIAVFLSKNRGSLESGLPN